MIDIHASLKLNVKRIPGGMCDRGESTLHALKREFMEEALDSLCKSHAECIDLEYLLKDLFENGYEVAFILL